MTDLPDTFGEEEAPDGCHAIRFHDGTPITPDGVIRAIREHSSGNPRSVRFDQIRDHYAAIAESVIRRDEIPLTRRDFIQRYFEALRTQKDAP